MNKNKAMIVLAMAVLGGGVIITEGAVAEVHKPQPVTIVEPEVPYNFTRWGVTGTVTVSFTIDAQGVPQNVQIESACNKVYAQNVIDAVSQWRFVPPEEPGVTYLMPVVFN